MEVVMATSTVSIPPAMAAGMRDFIVTGIEREMQTTSKVLGAVLDSNKNYKPDPHARSAHELAWHIAHGDVSFLEGIANMDFSYMQNEADDESKSRPNSSSDVVAFYDKSMAESVKKIKAMTPEQLATPVNFAGVFNLPVFMYLEFAKSHSIHHRGQLATYLRPMGSKCPSIYGGSYDEPWKG
jgi:uncharacterized damage-inducible protein DinB